MLRGSEGAIGCDRKMAGSRQCMTHIATSWTKMCRRATAQHVAPRLLTPGVREGVLAHAKRGRPSKKSLEGSAAPEEASPAPSQTVDAPIPPAPEDEAPAPKPKARRTRRTAAAATPVLPEDAEQPVMTSESHDSTWLAEPNPPTAYDYADPEPEPLPVAVTQQVTGLQMASDGVSGVQGSHKAATTGTAGQPEEADGSYGIKAGLDEDSFEKTTLRERIGHDVYQLRKNLSEGELPEGTILPRKYRLPEDATFRQTAAVKFSMARDYWQARADEQDYVHDLAWQAHHRSRERSVNIYANTRRVAGLISAFENDDYKLQNLAPSSIAPWARAEIVFGDELPEFNEMLRERAEDLVKRMPQEAQDEELDLLDEALFLLRPDEGNAAANKANQQSAEQELVDTYLEGMLPGATLDNLAASYADDIFDADKDGYGSPDDDTTRIPAVEEDGSKAEEAAE